MKGKMKSVLICFISLCAIMGIFFIMSSNINDSIEENLEISE